MTTMLEKAALAMFRAWNGPEDPHDEEMWAATREDYLTALRAALQAIREPDPKTVEAGCLAAQDGVGCTPWDNARAWEDGTDGASRQNVRDYVARAQTAMIDAILAEDKG